MRKGMKVETIYPADRRRRNYYRRMVFLPVLLLFCLFSFRAADVRAASIKMNKASATIAIDGSVTLKVMKDGTAVSGAVWGSSDTSVATVTQKGKVTGKLRGSAVITAMYNGTTVESVVSVVGKATSKTVRYNVLVLDRSGSMKGSPLKQTKKAAKRFAKTVMNADGTNYVAVVTLGSGSSVVCDFTTSYSKVSKAIGKIKASGHTNMRVAFAEGRKLLKKAPSGKNVIKNLILCSDGLPETGKKKASGRYSKKDHKDYKYANSVYALDKKMKGENDFIYALGFFHNSSGKDLTFGKRLMKDLASKDKYYVIQDSKDLKKTFNQIAKQIIDVTISDNSISLYVGKKKSLTAYLNGIAADAEWSSADPSIATVSSSGVVKGVSVGNTTVSAKVKGKTVTCKVKVKARDITNDFLLYGDAVFLDDGSIRLTECSTYRSGAAWYPKAINSSKKFTASFKFWAGGGRDDSYGGADGIVFNIAEETGLGSSGGNIGFAGYYGVELDSYPHNSGDPEGKHVAVVQGNISNHLSYVLDDRVDDSKWHTLKVVYKSKTLTIYLDGKKVLTQTGVELKSKSYFGLSAATGGGVNEHKVKEFKIQ